jgi:hypothetical protein
MEDTLELVSTCRRELLQGWWRPIGLVVSFMIFTASVQNVLDTTSYNTVLGILFSSIVCTCPYHRNLFNLIASSCVRA